MAKILYGISGEGNGHVTRSKAVIDNLKKDHEVVVLTSKNAFKYLSKKHKKVIKITDLYLHYKNNRVASFGTFWLNIKNLNKIIKSVKKVKRVIEREKPDIIINDFSSITNFAGLLSKKPLISIDNNQLVLKTKLDIPKKWKVAALKAKLAIRFTVFTTNWRFITTFFKPPVTSKRVTLIPPIIRKEVRKIKPSSKDYVLVYQTSNTNKELMRNLQEINENFIVYGFNKEKKVNNLKFKKFSEKGFLKDLKDAKAVIMNGGFSLISECIYLKKPIFSIPIDAQIEQMINGRYIQKLGIGKYCDENDIQEITLFLKNLKYYKKNMSKIKFDDKKYIKQLNAKIEELISLNS